MDVARSWSSPEGRHGKFYDSPVPEVQLRMEREALGTAAGVRGYTTLEQADLLAEALRLSARSRLLDVGAGRGWPGLYLAQRAGCSAVLSDISHGALISARERGAELGIDASGLRAAADLLPLRAGVFDAVVSTDVL